MTHAPHLQTVKAAVVGDAESLASVHAAAFEDGWKGAAFREFLGRPACLAFVALGAQDGAVVGFILGQAVADEAEVLTMAVTPSARRCGVGRSLLSALLHAASDRGVATVHLDVAADNTSALALYRAAGFVVSGRRTAYYDRASGRIDAVTMVRALG
jgi:ribosomal-protein-alanine N-acetyltransferase